MELTLIVAIIHSDKVDAAEQRLHEIGVRGITIIKAKGFGDQSLDRDILGRLLLNNQAKMEIYAPREQAERIAKTLIEAARTGMPGDGIVAILPVERVFSVRTGCDTVPNRGSVRQAPAYAASVQPSLERSVN